MPTANSLIHQAKTASDEAIGYKFTHYGNFVAIKDLELSEEEQIFLGDGELVYFNLGVLMERRKANIEIAKLEEDLQTLKLHVLELEQKKPVKKVPPKKETASA